MGSLDRSVAASVHIREHCLNGLPAISAAEAAMIPPATIVAACANRASVGVLAGGSNMASAGEMSGRALRVHIDFTRRPTRRVMSNVAKKTEYETLRLVVLVW